MSPQINEEYTSIMAERYRRARFSLKSALLNEYCENTGLHRKSAIRKLNNFNYDSTRD